MDSSIISDIRRHLATLHKRRTLIVTCLLVAVLAATLYNYTARPLYQATVLILLEADTPNLLGRNQVVPRHNTEALNTQFQILRGRGLAEAVIAKLRLQDTPEFLAGPVISPWERFQRSVLGRTTSSALVAADDVSPNAAWFRSRVQIEPVPQSNLVNVRFAAYDPKVAAVVANTLAQLYIEQTVMASGSEQTEAQGWLSERLGEQRKAIGQDARQMRDYEKRQGLLNLDERQRLAESKLNATHSALVQARTTRLSKEATYRQMTGLTPEQLEESPLVMSNGVVQGLRARLAEHERSQQKLADTLGERHPDMQRLQSEIEDARRRLNDEIQKLSRSLETDYKMALRQEESLQSSLDPIQQELDELRQKSVEYGMLKREAEANEQVLKNLINRSKETGLESEIPVRNVRVIEKALPPQSPISPRRRRNYELALIIGLSLGIAITVVLEQMDDSMKTPDDVKQYLGIAFLGMVPDSLRRGQKGVALSPLILNNPRSPLAESYRVIRTNLIFSAAEGRRRALMVSSVNPAEGKSTTVANLAVSLAQNGQSVLVIDADLRRPTLHRHFNVSSVPGLSDAIVGNCTLEQAVRVGVAKGLDVMPCGYVPPNPAELLGSSPMRDLVINLRDAYDWVLIDAPPILTMADAPVLCPVVDGLILVVAAERTARHAALRSIEQVSAVGGRVLGVVLNRVDLERNSYYFGRYYGDYYRSYYQDAANRRTDSVATGSDPQTRM